MRCNHQAFEVVVDVLRQNHVELDNLGATPTRGILLSGPPGVGKTTAVELATTHAGAELVSIPCAHLRRVTDYGAADEILRTAFEKADAASHKAVRGVVFLDEIDGLCPKRDGLDSDRFTARVTAQLLTLMDGVGVHGHSGRCLVIGATNRPYAIDAALRRPGRFDVDLMIPPPDQATRLQILRGLAAAQASDGIVVDPAIVSVLADRTQGYVAADLANLWDRTMTGNRSPELNQFLTIARTIRPSLLRGPFTVDTRVCRWDDIAGLGQAKRRLRMAVEWPVRYKATWQKLGLVGNENLGVIPHIHKELSSRRPMISSCGSVNALNRLLLVEFSYMVLQDAGKLA